MSRAAGSRRRAATTAAGFLENGLRGASVQVLTATRQLAPDSAELGCGFVTYVLLQGLKGGDYDFVDEFIRDGGHRQFKQFGIGSLEHHFASWASPVIAFPKLLVRYEELKEDPERELKRIAAFIKLKRTGEQIALAVRNATEGEMRRLEETEIAEMRHGIFYQDRNRSAIEAGHRFVGRSATGASRYRLTPEQRERATRRFAALIKQMGYQAAS
jgi:hypothetical protein